MKNITVSLQDDVARWARVWAAEHECSMSRMLGRMLEERMREQNGYEVAMREFLAVEPRPLRKAGEGLPSRDEIHERN